MGRVRRKGPPESTSDLRRASLRAGPVPGRAWVWSLVAGGLALVALVLGLRLANRLVVLPAQQLPDLGAVPQHTVVALLVMSAPVAGIVEEAAFRGYMQGPIERRYGIAVAILITGTMFAVAHLDFTLILWPCRQRRRSLRCRDLSDRIKSGREWCCTPPAIPIRISTCGCGAGRNGRQHQDRGRLFGALVPTRRS